MVSLLPCPYRCCCYDTVEEATSVINLIAPLTSEGGQNHFNPVAV